MPVGRIIKIVMSAKLQKRIFERKSRDCQNAFGSA